MTFSLSISTNPLINRFAEPDDLMSVIADEIGVRRVQLTHELINPDWPAPVLRKLTDSYGRLCAQRRLAITSVCTGASGRLNNLGHPDRDVWRWTVEWMKRLATLAADLGARAVGSQFAILTYRDFDQPHRREAIIERALDGWSEIYEHGQRVGLDFVFWEHMSVGRELGETISSCRALKDRIAKRSGLALKLMLDVDHGDVASGDADDTNPYRWLEVFGRDCPIVHMKQASASKTGHWPFVEPYNSAGRIEPAAVIAALSSTGNDFAEICLELAFRERDPADRQAVDLLRRSVEYWRPFVAD